MKGFLFGLILLSTAAFADGNIVITDIVVKEGQQVIVFVDEIGRYVTVAEEDATQIVFDAKDVLPGRHTAVVRIKDDKLVVVEVTKEIEVE